MTAATGFKIDKGLHQVQRIFIANFFNYLLNFQDISGCLRTVLRGTVIHAIMFSSAVNGSRLVKIAFEARRL